MSKKILLIEDDTLVRETVQDVLSIGGYDIEIAENGLIGYQKIKEMNPDLVISDVMMPKMDGFELIQRLESESVRVKFLFLSAKSREEDLLKGLRLGADDYLVKPFNNMELLNKVEELISD
jgi:DNA-binding response OmpR family regulator